MATRLPEKREALRFATIDSTVALMFALTINASILILAAAASTRPAGRTWRSSARRMRCSTRCWAQALAPTLFGIALLGCGLNSTVTATLAGQIVMEGFLIRLAPWLRRLVDPRHRHRSGGRRDHLVRRRGTAKLLILSQVVLSLQLPFAVIPLVMFTASRASSGELVAPRWLTAVAA